MRKLLLVLILILVPMCFAKGKPTPAPTSLLAPHSWELMYHTGCDDPGCPSSARFYYYNPLPLPVGSGWYFNFPQSITQKPGSIGYAKLNYTSSLLGKSAITFTAEVVGDAEFKYDTNPNNTCIFPSHVRLYIEHSRVDMWNEYHRWWSNPIAMEITNGTLTLSTPLTADQWTDVYGARGSDFAAQWQDAFSHPGKIGFSFGGGCFFGHGVYATGNAQFILKDFRVQ